MTELQRKNEAVRKRLAEYKTKQDMEKSAREETLLKVCVCVSVCECVCVCVCMCVHARVRCVHIRYPWLLYS